MMAVMSCNTRPVYIWDDSYFSTLIARFLGPTWGPSGADRTQVGPMLAPWTLLSGYTFIRFQQNCNATKQYHEIHSICRLIKIGICRRSSADHDEIIKWKHFPRYWPFVRRIHRSPVNSHRKGQWRGTCLNKRLSKQSWGLWFGMPLCPLWRHCNAQTLCHTQKESRLRLWKGEILCKNKTLFQTRTFVRQI